MAESGIITGQYVRIQPTVASVGDRIFAQLIDWLVIIAYMVLLLWIDATLKTSDSVIMYVLLILPPMFYTLLCEIFNQGRSLGKMVMKMRVIKQDGTSPSLGSYLMRWMLYLIDGPLTSFAGLVIMILTRDNQRLGDLSLDEYDYLAKNYTPRYPQAADLALEQIDIITRAINTRSDDFAQRLSLLAKKVQQKLNIEKKEANDLAFLQRIVRDYQYYALEEI